MATFSLADLKNEVSKKYSPTVVENGDDEYTLPNLLQMPEKQRKQVQDLIDSIDDSDDAELSDQIAVFKKIIETATAGDKGAELLGLLGDNAAMLLELVTTWMDGSALGEA